jgi:CheY-like chemotaxis protein
MAPQRLLVVEDDVLSRTVLWSALTLRGWSVETAASLAEARTKLDPPPDCLLLDLFLTDGDGEDLLRRVRADGLPTRVVVSTGCIDAERLAALPALGAQAVVAKPLDVAEVHRACRGPSPPG